jgi:hypothetical protein
MRELFNNFFDSWWPHIILLVLFVGFLGWAIPASIVAVNNDKDICESSHGIYLSGGKGGSATCIIGENLRELDLK